MQSRITGLEEQLLIQRGQLALQQQQLQQAVELLQGMAAQSMGQTGMGVAPVRRGAFYPSPANVQEPQIEIQDFRGDSSQIWCHSTTCFRGNCKN